MRTLIRTRKSSLGAFAGAALAVALLATGCAREQATAGGGGEALSIGYLPKMLGNPYFEHAGQGASEATDELGGSYQQVGPAVGAADAQVSYINTLAQQGVDGIVISASDPSALGQSLSTARSAGAKVVTFDSDVEPEYRDLFVSPAVDLSISKAVVDLLVEKAGDTGEVAILGASPNALNQQAWISGINEVIATDYPGLKVVETFYANDDDQESFDKTAATIQKNPDLIGVLSTSTVGTAAAARYISESAFADTVALSGIGTPNAMRDFVESGFMEKFVLFSPADMGYLATFAIDAMIDGTITGAEGDTFSAGRLGDYTVQEGGIVYVGDPIIFDATNIDDYDF